MATRTSRDFTVFVGNNDPLVLAGKAKAVVDGMGTRIYNHDGSVAYSSPSTSVSFVETNSYEETIADPVVPGNGEPTE
jgi:hypothetical protein